MCVGGICVKAGSCSRSGGINEFTYNVTQPKERLKVTLYNTQQDYLKLLRRNEKF